MARGEGIGYLGAVHPVLFSLPNGFSIHVYGFMIAVGTVLAVGVASRWAVKDGFDKDLFTDLGFWAILAGVVGARMEYVRVNASQFQDLQQMVNVRDGGLVFYGGLIAVLVTFVIIVKRRKLPMLKVLDIMAPLIPLGIMFGRLGCFAAGCCYGHQTDVAWAVRFPDDPLTAAPAGLPLHPTQLYEVAYGGLLFGLLTWMRSHKRFDGQLILSFLSLYPILRSINELFRGDPGRGWFMEAQLGEVLSNAQAISVVVALFAAVGWGLLWKRTRPA